MIEADILSPGQSLGRYELLAQVARGGMGQVWVARLKGARGFQKVVAIKTLLPELCDDKRIEQMLLEEARIASLIQHPNVVQTTELGEHRGYLYLVMEWLHGESLAFVQKRAEERGAIPLPVAVNLVAQACSGLHAAHELTNDLGVPLGVVHRDVSPHNMLVTHTGVVKLVDFGIAKAMNQDSSFTENGEIKGKYSYMAPEQVLGEDVDRRADVFSIGITLYMATTGRHPFKTGDKANVIRAITSAEPAVRPSVHVPDYPPDLEAIVMKALEKRPEDRFATAEALRSALEGAVPEAFTLGFETQVKAYLTRVMGDRAIARQEALRRFQIAADERQLTGVGAGSQSQMTSQSAGSLRAIMVDNVPVEIGPNAASKNHASQAPTEIRRSQVPTRAGVRPRRRTGFALAFAAAGVLSAVLALRFSHQSPGSATAGHASPRPLATLPTTPTVALPLTAPASPAASPSALRPPPDAAAEKLALPSAPASAKARAAPPERAAPSSARAKKSRKSAASRELMAPEYAK